jgi:pyruvate/2-oxoglutarate dehydrogenase complex dihydrolipoamide acyltransferase (E2) component
MEIQLSNMSHSVLPFPKLRNFVLDVMEEGRSQNTVYVQFDVDITAVRETLQKIKASNLQSISLTGFIAKCLAQTVSEQKHVHAIRNGKKLILFDDVDIATMIEREVDGFMQPVNYIIRASQKKTMHEIQEELKKAKTEPIGGDYAMNKIERFFFGLPRAFRRIFWHLSHKKAELRKQFVGTVGLTNVGMFGEGAAFVLPITPMTLTLAIGTIQKRPAIVDGILEEREFLCLTIGVNHDIIDGGPLMRFVARLKELLHSGHGLPSLVGVQLTHIELNQYASHNQQKSVISMKSES